MMIGKINKRTAFYVVFAISALLFFLYARFPDRVVEKYLLNRLAESNPGTFLSVGSVSLTLPPGLQVENVLFGFKDNQDATIRLESLKVRPRLTGYLTGHASFAVRAAAYSGVLGGRVDFPHLQPGKSPESVDIRFEGVALEKCDYLKEKLGRQVRGRLSGDFAQHGESKLDFVVKNGSYPLLVSLFGLNRLDFSKTEGQLILKGQVLKINKLKLTGDKVNLSLKGNILLKPEFKDSELNLNGAMEIAALGNKKIALAISGTIGNAKTTYQ